jgi:hypothetical protein
LCNFFVKPEIACFKTVVHIKRFDFKAEMKLFPKKGFFPPYFLSFHIGIAYIHCFINSRVGFSFVFVLRREFMEVNFCTKDFSYGC